MGIKQLWPKFKPYPGIFGFIILVVDFLLARQGGEKVLLTFALQVLLTMPVVTVLCGGALIKGFRGVLHRQGEAADTRPGVLRWLDTLLAFVGICLIVFIALGLNPHASDLPERIALIGGFLFFSSVGYFLFSKWRLYDAGKRVAFGLIWVVGAGVTYIEVSGIALTSVEGPFLKDAMIADLNNFAAYAYQYRIRPKSMQGGSGSYVGYVIPKRMSSNEDGEYSVTAVSPDTIEFNGSAPDGKSGITVRVDKDGKLFDWRYRGDFQPGFEEWLEEIWRR